ncbi:MAG: hypothetical protein ACI4VC_00355 [Clostridia bacterium]
MAKKKEEVKTIVWVFWILIAIIGVSMLFAGIQSSFIGDNIVTSIMLVIVGTILLFIGLIMVIGKANIIANDLEMPKLSKTEKKEEKK